ncbi:MAG: hypothetical protein V3U39_08885, partial [Acidimicrobiia bacterium]
RPIHSFFGSASSQGPLRGLFSLPSYYPFFGSASSQGPHSVLLGEDRLSKAKARRGSLKPFRVR